MIEEALGREKGAVKATRQKLALRMGREMADELIQVLADVDVMVQGACIRHTAMCPFMGGIHDRIIKHVTLEV